MHYNLFPTYHERVLTFVSCIRQNLEAWEEAKKEIALIPDHPNRLPEGEAQNSADASKPTPSPADLSLRRHTGLR